MSADMTARERTELAQLCRRREKVAKTMATQRSAELLADFEAQLATEYAWDEHETWAEAMRVASAAVDEVNEAIADSLRELGVPKRFAPRASMGWQGRGENEVAKRRAELRKVAQTRIAALEKGARTKIERVSLETQTELLAGGLESGAARRFLDAMPTAESLMPTLAMGDIEKQLGSGNSG